MSTAAAVALGIVFIASGSLKLRDPMWPGAARVLGAPNWVVPAVAPFELILGALLVAGFAQRQFAILAFVTLSVFTLLLVRIMRSDDDAPACACFGSFSAAPVGIRSIMRNEAFMVIAVVAAI